MMSDSMLIFILNLIVLRHVAYSFSTKELEEGLQALQFNFNVYGMKLPSPASVCTRSCVYNRQDGECATKPFQFSKYCLRKGLQGITQNISMSQIYFQPQVQLSWHSALRACRKLGMKLGSIETETKKLSVISLVSSSMGNQSNVEMWTSGNSLGQLGFFSWIETGKVLREKQNFVQKSCLQLSIPAITSKQAEVKPDICSKSKRFFCDVNPTCLIKNCNKDTLYKEVKKQSGTNNNGNRVSSDLIITSCGTTYYVSKHKLSSKPAREKCEKLGMVAAMFESSEEVTCVRDALKLGEKEEVVSWGANYSVLCTRKSCPLSRMFSSNTPWLEGEPEKWFKGSPCVAHMFSQRTSGALVLDCRSLLRIICQTESGELSEETKTSLEMFNNEKIKDDKFMYTPIFKSLAKVAMGTCEQYYCKNDENANITQNGTLYVEPSIGSVKVGCGKQYLFTRKLKTSINSYKGCCSFGFQTATIFTLDEMICVNELFRELQLKTTLYWGPFLDVFLSRSFDTCVIEGAVLPRDLNYPGEPNNLDGREPCIMYVMSPCGIAGYADMVCTEIDAFNLCEAPHPFVGGPPPQRFAKKKSSTKKRN